MPTSDAVFPRRIRPWGAVTLGLGVVVATASCRGGASDAVEGAVAAAGSSAQAAATGPAALPTPTASALGQWGSEAQGAPPSTQISELPQVRLPLALDDLPSQRAVCFAGGFGWLSREGFEVFTFPRFDVLARWSLQQPRNAVELAGNGALVFSLSKTQRYTFGQTKAVDFARIPALGPFEVRPDSRDIDSFWVRYLRDPAVHNFRLRKADGSPSLSEVRELPDHDGQRLAWLSDGALLYTTGKERVTWSGVGKSFDVETRGARWALVADRRWDRFWIFEDSGRLQQIELSRGQPRAADFDLGGAPLAWARRDLNWVVLHGRQGEQGLWLTYFEREDERRTLQLALEPAASSAAGTRWSVCLVPEQRSAWLATDSAAWLVDLQTGSLRFQRVLPPQERQSP